MLPLSFSRDIWLEIISMLVLSLGILVSGSTAALFLLAHAVERQLHTIWRALGFGVLAVACFVLFGEPLVLDMHTIVLGTILQFIAFFFIYEGVRADLILSHLQHLPTLEERTRAARALPDARSQRRTFMTAICIAAAIVLVLLTVPHWLPVANELGTMLFIGLTIYFQVKRYHLDSQDLAVRRQNLYPLFAYIAFFVRGAALVLFRLPRAAHLETSSTLVAWQWSIVFTGIGFTLLALWAWNFIKIRSLLSSSVLLFASICMVSLFVIAIVVVLILLSMIYLLHIV